MPDFRPGAGAIARIIVVAAALSLSACGDGEAGRDRVFELDKGGYKGRLDQPLAPETVERLRERAGHGQF